MSITEIVVAYIPAIHEGYIRFFNAHKGAIFYVVDDSVIKELSIETPYYGRDVRAISSVVIRGLIESLGIFKEVKTLTSAIKIPKNAGIHIVMPDEDISHSVKKKYLSEVPVIFESVFLRWDKKISMTEYEVKSDRIISISEFDRNLIDEATKEGNKSSDWWRQIGALIVKDGKVLISSHNTHLPTPENPNVLGDPRSNFDASDVSTKGLSTAIHAEAGIVAEAARKGLSLENAHIYVSTFPCPACARLVARAGVKKVFYASGYSVLDAEEILKNAKVEIVMVKVS